MLTKALNEITPADIVELCTLGAYESQTLELKQDLPGDGGRTDAWNAGGKMNPSARDGLLREIIAFANAQGGTLIVGIEETDEKPARAKAVRPLERVHELADSLQEAARACIEPPLSALQAAGIETSARGSGVVLLRTPPSLTGPHRVSGHGHAYIRRGTSAVQMTMREIQDLTIDLARGAERLDELFLQRASLFRTWLYGSSSKEVGAYRITALPIGSFPTLPRLSADPRTFPLRVDYRRRVLIDQSEMDCVAPVLPGLRPIVRGVRLYSNDDSTRLEILQTGLVDMWSKHGEMADRKHFYVNWLLGGYLLLLNYIDTIRSFSNAPDFEFAVELSLDGYTHTPAFGGGMVPLQSLMIGSPNRPYDTWRIQGLPVTLPRIPTRNRNDISDVLNLAASDLFDATGEQPPWNQLTLPG